MSQIIGLLKDLPSPEEYNKRKVALISGLAASFGLFFERGANRRVGITGQDGSYL
jgi:hypothetical protein